MRIEKWLMLGLSLGLVACGGSSSSPDSEESAGGDVTQYEGAIASDDVAGGQELFSLHCDDCHPDGEEDVGPSLIADPHVPARLRQQVREGSGKMRPFSAARLPDEDLEKILAYMDSIGAVKK